jgi:hypothetical protein
MNGFQGPPAVDFYSQLSGLGDTIAKTRQDAAKRDALAAALQPGADGTVDYGRAMLGLAGVDPQAASLFAQAQNHKDTLAQQAITNARADRSEAATAQARKDANFRADREWNYDPAEERKQQAIDAHIDPNSPAGQQFILTGALPTASKPMPFETLGGTRFMVPKPDGSYTIVDPSAAGQQPVGQPSAPAGPTAPAPATPLQGQPQPTPAISPPVATTQPADVNVVDPNTGRREAWLQSQPPGVQAYIKKIADYEIDPRTSSLKGGHREQMLSAVAQYDPTYNQNEFGSRAKAIKDFSTGPQGNIIRSFDVAIDHLDTLQKAATAMQNGNMKLLNEVRNHWRNQTGSDLPTNFQALVPLVSGEIAKAVIGSNNALSDREELRTNLKAANSPDQISGVITGYKGLMSGQLKGLRKQYEQTTGRKDFDSRLREHTLKELSATDKAAPVTIDGYTIKEN